jgi:hypothetical protein
MNRTAKLLLVALAGLALVCALAKVEVAAQVINTGSTFEGWTGGGCGGTGTCSVTVTGNTAVSARFSVLGLRGLP